MERRRPYQAALGSGKGDAALLPASNGINYANYIHYSLLLANLIRLHYVRVQAENCIDNYHTIAKVKRDFERRYPNVLRPTSVFFIENSPTTGCIA